MRGSLRGPHCDVDPTDSLFGACVCQSSTDCSPNGLACKSASSGQTAQCAYAYCQMDSDCAPGSFCDVSRTCRPRCDDGGQGCMGSDLLCDRGNQNGQNGYGNHGALPGSIWCWGCLTPSDCGPGLACTGVCSSVCYVDSPITGCPAGEVCAYPDDCRPTCDAGECPAGQVCDTQGVAGNGPYVCYPCISAADCPDGLGCDSVTHACGTCEGPTKSGGPSDCPPDAICSNYWDGQTGVCLQNCDVFPCQDPSKTCQVLPDLTIDHRYCFGCIRDSDCADAGSGAWCDTSVNRTFTCRPPGGL
jgi:hypothetical protein